MKGVGQGLDARHQGGQPRRGQHSETEKDQNAETAQPGLDRIQSKVARYAPCHIHGVLSGLSDTEAAVDAADDADDERRSRA